MLLHSQFMRISFEEEGFPTMYAGGCERAPMSTTTSFRVAVQYGASSNALIFKIATENFRQRGANIKFLSAFPREEEVLYPPGTFLQPTGKQEKIEMHGATFTVVEVRPDID